MTDTHSMQHIGKKNKNKHVKEEDRLDVAQKQVESWNWLSTYLAKFVCMLIGIFFLKKQQACILLMYMLARSNST